MLLKTILNRIERHKSFVYGDDRIIEEGDRLAIEIDVKPRANGRPVCSGCGFPGACHGRMPQPRRFEYVPLWGMAVYLVYTMRRVNCPACGVKVERVPWAEGKEQLTTSYKWFLASWAKRICSFCWASCVNPIDHGTYGGRLPWSTRRMTSRFVMGRFPS